ncbi:MAG: DUF502 domain-containing protein [Pseudomonadales bacterium]
MSHITTTFLRGLGAVLPAALTVWLVVWLAMATEALLRPVFLFLLPERYYLPGLGFALGVAIIYVVGVLVQTFLIGRLWDALMRLFEGVPLVKTVYSALSDFFDFFSRRRPTEGSSVVSVDVLDNDIRLIGFVTDDRPASLTEPGADSPVAVYLPLSYQIGGFTLLIPRSRLTRLDIGVEDAMRLVLTAGIQRRKGRED